MFSITMSCMLGSVLLIHCPWEKEGNRALRSSMNPAWMKGNNNAINHIVYHLDGSIVLRVVYGYHYITLCIEIGYQGFDNGWHEKFGKLYPTQIFLG